MLTGAEELERVRSHFGFALETVKYFTISNSFFFHTCLSSELHLVYYSSVSVSISFSIFSVFLVMVLTTFSYSY
jgi:hypothetical protein